MGQIVERNQQNVDLLMSALRSKESYLAKLLPPSLPVRRFLATVYSAVIESPRIADCTQESVFNSLHTAAELRLPIAKAGAISYLVPYNNRRAQTLECKLIIGYGGLRALAYRSGAVSMITNDVVREGDKFAYRLGASPMCEHTPAQEDRGEIVGAYACARIKGSEEYPIVVYMPIADILEQAAKTPGYDMPGSFWASHREAMVAKTPLRRLCTRHLPLVDVSTEIQMALEAEDRASKELEYLIEDSSLERLRKSASGEEIINAEFEGDPAPFDQCETKKQQEHVVCQFCGDKGLAGGCEECGTISGDETLGGVNWEDVQG